MEYTSIDNNKIKDIKKLQQKKYRDETNLFLVEGKHLVEEAYKSGYLKTLIKVSDKEYNLDIDTMEVSKKVYKYLSLLENGSGIIGICKKINTELKNDRIIILDNIQDPGNLGTIIRSAVAFSSDIILSNDSVDMYNFKTIRASGGLLFYSNIIETDIKIKILELKELGYKIIGTSVNGGEVLKNLEKTNKVAIIMGNEGNGISEEILNLCDDLIYIKTNEKVESLNVAVATSIILYELER